MVTFSTHFKTVAEKDAKYNLREQLLTEGEIESLLLEGGRRRGSKEEARGTKKRQWEEKRGKGSREEKGFLLPANISDPISSVLHLRGKVAARIEAQVG